MRILDMVILIFLLSLTVRSNSQSEVHLSVMPKTEIFNLSEMDILSPGFVDDGGLPGSENYKVEYTATVDLVYGREQLTDILNYEWGYRVAFSVFNSQHALVGSGTLTVQNFGTTTIYLDKQRFTTDRSARLVITGIETSTDNWQTSSTTRLDALLHTPADIRLELRIEAKRYDHLDPITPIDGLTLTHEGEDILMEWPYATGAESYHVEFIFVTDFTIANPLIDELFKDASRVEIQGNSFRLKNTYPPGDLYVRVRPVGRHIRGVNSPATEYIQSLGAWSTEESITTNFEPGQTWKVTTSYAEEGKYKKVIEYYDDALKLRQTATNLSSENTIIRSTTHYDFEGRPVITVLPSPDLNSNSFALIPGFNTLTPQTFEDPNLSHALPTLNGAGLYYSAANPQTQGIHSGYIPDSEGFAYTRSRFLNDGTGRLIEQGGVGDLYRIGTDHSTRYFYDDPSSTQLRRLFGSNVGLAKYYKRNIVQDPNGQLAVNYIDHTGRTIATALAGDSPSNVHDLPSQSTGTYDIVEDLMENNIIDSLTGASMVTTYLFNEEPGDYYFNYGLDGLNINYGEGICKSCRYELVIEMIDPHGVALPGGLIEHQFSGDDLCAEETYSEDLNEIGPIQFSQVGMYTVIKTLRPVPLSIEEWMNELSGILPTLEFFEELYLSQIDTNECTQSCEQYCRDSILTLNPELIDDPYLDILVEECAFTRCVDDLITESSESVCDAMESLMIAQLMEGGCQFDAWANASDLAGITFLVEGEPVDGMILHPLLRPANPDDGGIIWEDSWDNQLLPLHPSIACLNYCYELEPNRIFDSKIFADYRWEDVNSQNDIENFVEVLDPFFSSGPGNSGEMLAILTNYGTINNNDVEACGLNFPGNVSLSQMIECVMPAATDEEKFEFFIGAYLGIKHKLVENAQPNPTEAADCQVCIETPDDFANIDSVEDAIDNFNDEQDLLCNDVCIGQATMAANFFSVFCENVVWQEIFDLVMAHCTTACNWQNPLGMILSEDSDMPTFQAIQNWADIHNCGLYFLHDLVYNFDEVYEKAGYPQNPGISIKDTICPDTVINLYRLHDSLYQASIDPLLLPGLLNGQTHLLDTGLYILIGFDSLCGQFADPPAPDYFEVNFDFANQPGPWQPETMMGAWPTMSNFEDGCYTFGFYTPEPNGACEAYSEVILHIPNCDSIFLVVDSLDLCAVRAHIEYGINVPPVTAVIFTVSIDDAPPVPYIEGDILTEGKSYQFFVEITFEYCCAPKELSDGIDCACKTIDAEPIGGTPLGFDHVTAPPDSWSAGPTLIYEANTLLRYFAEALDPPNGNPVTFTLDYNGQTEMGTTTSELYNTAEYVLHECPWIDDLTPTCGPLDRTAIWSDDSNAEMIVASLCFDVEETGTYYVGFGVDNAGYISIDNARFIDLGISHDVPNELIWATFGSWWIVPVYLTEGNHVITCHAVTSSGTLRATGFEVYDATPSELLSVTTTQQLAPYIIANSLELTEPGYNNISFGSGGAFTCPAGFEPYYDGCVPKCRLCEIPPFAALDQAEIALQNIQLQAPVDTTGHKDIVEKVSDKATLNIRPNPAHHEVHIEFIHNYQIKNGYTLNIFDASNNVVYNNHFASAGNNDYLKLDVSHFPPGVYTVFIIDEKGKYNRKLVVIK